MTMTEAAPFIRCLYGVEAVEPDGCRWVVSIEKYRTRRQWALTMTCPDTPGRHEVVAYFKSEAKAERFANFLRVLVNDR